jgi:hypothetical protein
MLIFRLLPFSLLIVAGVATLAAQSSPDKNRVVVQPTEPIEPNSPASSDLFSSNLKTGLNPSGPMDRILIGDNTPRLSQFSVPRKFIVDSDGQPTDDLCLTMRTYKVARDDPHSDSTHAAGYSTCTPAARFQMRTTEFRIWPTKP